MNNPSINSEAYRQQQVEVERHEAHIDAIDRFAVAAPTREEFLLMYAERMLNAIEAALAYYAPVPPTYDEHDRAIYPPLVIPDEVATELYNAARAAKGEVGR